MRYFLYRGDKYISEATNKQSLIDVYENEILHSTSNWYIEKTSNRSNNVLKKWFIDTDNLRLVVEK